jgi:hypothetical protein
MKEGTIIIIRRAQNKIPLFGPQHHDSLPELAFKGRRPFELSSGLWVLDISQQAYA